MKEKLDITAFAKLCEEIKPTQIVYDAAYQTESEYIPADTVTILFFDTIETDTAAGTITLRAGKSLMRFKGVEWIEHTAAPDETGKRFINFFSIARNKPRKNKAATIVKDYITAYSTL